MRGHALAGRVALVEKPRHGEVAVRPLTGKHVLVHGGAHDRMDEARAGAVHEHVGLDQEICRRSCLGQAESGRLGHETDVSCSCPSTASAWASAVDAGPSRSSRRRTKRPTAGGPTSLTARAARLAGPPIVRQSRDELAQEEWISAGGAMARVAELLLGVVPEPVAHDRASRLLGQGTRPQDLGGCVVCELAPDARAFRVR